MRYDACIRNEVVRLYRSGKSIKKVATELGVHRSSVYRWVKSAGVVRSLSDAQKGRIISQEQREKTSRSLKGRFMGDERWNFKCLKDGYDTPSSEFAYLLGVLFGDGFLFEGGIGLQSKDREFVDEFARCLQVQFGHPAKIYEWSPRLIRFKKDNKAYMNSKSFALRFFSVAAKEFLKKIKNWDYVFNLPSEYLKDFIRGLWDSEGTIGLPYHQVKFCTKDYVMAQNYQRLLKEVLGIDAHINPARSGMYYVNFARLVDVVKFYEMIQPTIVRKRVILEQAVARANVLNQR